MFSVDRTGMEEDARGEQEGLRRRRSDSTPGVEEEAKGELVRLLRPRSDYIPGVEEEAKGDPYDPPDAPNVTTPRVAREPHVEINVQLRPLHDSTSLH